MKKFTYLKNLVLVLFLIMTGVVNSTTTTITINLESAGGSANLGSGIYGSGAERIWTQSDISFGGKAITAANSPNVGSIQAQANNGVLYNTSALPGKLISVTISSWSGTTDQASTLYVGSAERLVNNIAANYTVGGTSLGVSTPGSWTISTEDDYRYFAIKRGANAAYWATVTIIYQSPSSSCTSSTLSFPSETIEKVVGDLNYTSAASSLNATTPIIYASSNTEVATVDAATGQVTILTVGQTTISATQAEGTHNDVDYCAGSDSYLLNVSPSAPTITITEVSIPEMITQLGQTDTETIHVGGINLTGDIQLTVTGANADLFTLSTSQLSPVDGEVESTVVTITYTPVEVGVHAATLEFVSPGAETVQRALNGRALTPYNLGSVIISEVYGGGGNTDATYKNDFIELYNTTDQPIDISGWRLQYYSATGTGTASSSTNSFVIPEEKVIAPKEYFLIQAAAGTGGTVDLPTPDATSSINIAAAAGKVIVYRTNAAQTITSDVTSITGNPYFVDYLPFGSTATPVLGSSMATMSGNVNSATRKMKINFDTGLPEYLYTMNIGNDFKSMPANPGYAPPVAAVPSFTPNGAVGLVASTEVVITSAIENADIYYSLDGGENFELYEDPLIITGNSTVKAYVAETNAYFESPVATAQFSFTSTGVEVVSLRKLIYSLNGKIILEATKNTTVDVYTVTGQRLVSKTLTKGLHSIDIATKGVVIVKMGDQITKVILE